MTAVNPHHLSLLLPWLSWWRLRIYKKPRFDGLIFRTVRGYQKWNVGTRILRQDFELILGRGWYSPLLSKLHFYLWRSLNYLYTYVCYSFFTTSCLPLQVSKGLRNGCGWNSVRQSDGICKLFENSLEKADFVTCQKSFLKKSFCEQNQWLIKNSSKKSKSESDVSESNIQA